MSYKLPKCKEIVVFYIFPSPAGDAGHLVVELAVPIQPTRVTLEHLDKKIDRYTRDMYKLAPRECEVYGWLDSQGNGKVHIVGRIFILYLSNFHT